MSTSSLEIQWRRAVAYSAIPVWIYVFIDVVISVSTTPTSTDMYIRKSINFFLSTFLPFGIVRSFREKIVSQGTLAYLLQCGAISTTLAACGGKPSRPTSIEAVVLMLVIAITNLPYWGLHYITLVPCLFINAYNATLGMDGYPLITIVGPSSENLFRELVAQSRLLWVVPLAIALTRTLSNAYFASTRKLEGAVAVAKQVSEHLAEYNTKDAEAVLLEYAQTVDHDVGLHDVLRVIVENLNRYKPHLPNYLVSAAVPAQDEGQVVDNKCVLSLESIPQFPKSAVVKIIVEDLNDGKSTPPFVNNDDDDMFSTKENLVDRSVKKKRSKKALASTKMDPTNLLAMIPAQREVSYALLHYKYHNEDVIDNPKPLRSFVDKVYQYTTSTRGVVHSCLGDTVHMTWNGVTSVPKPEDRAVGLFQMFHSHSDMWSSSGTTSSEMVVSNTYSVSHHLSSRVEVCGSVMTGMGECRMTGTSFHTFLFHMDWWEEQYALHRYSRRVGANVVCKKTAKSIDIPVLLVDIIDEADDIEVYEVLIEEEIDDNPMNAQYKKLVEDSVKAYHRKDREAMAVYIQQLNESNGNKLRSSKGGELKSVAVLKEKLRSYIS
eukprot:PhF_6_TR36141/c0_g1_i2/m.52509